jgi:hypothetical protein
MEPLHLSWQELGESFARKAEMYLQSSKDIFADESILRSKKIKGIQELDHKTLVQIAMFEEILKIIKNETSKRSATRDELISRIKTQHERASTAHCELSIILDHTASEV